MTYQEIKKQIKMLEGLKVGAEKQVTGYRTKEVCTQIGQGDYVPTGRYEVVPEYTYVQPACNLKIDKEIERLMRLPEYQAGKAEEEEKKHARFIQQKAKRYRKELEELNERKAYLEKWLAENDIEG